jgi:hypothetical protein
VSALWNLEEPQVVLRDSPVMLDFDGHLRAERKLARELLERHPILIRVQFKRLPKDPVSSQKALRSDLCLQG